MEKFAFVILHYILSEDTEECVQSIRDSIYGFKYRIYIVDNASSNESGKLLTSKYKFDDDICVICNKENMGFARGNNIGIQMARRQGYDDFIVVLNNDVLLKQRKFCKLIQESYHRNNFAVLGPLIYTPQGICELSPGSQKILDGERLLNYERKIRIKRMLAKMHMHFCLNLFSCAKSLFKQKKKKIPELKENCWLHGCCLIFSKKYFMIFHGFDPRTFLYAEEDILFAKCLRNGLKTVFDPSLSVYHKEYVSTKQIFKSSRERHLFRYSCILNALRIYKIVLKEIS
ncbi:MAG: glycosyltransferase [Fibrobacteraceae bacterium]|nr:glycosyltransferase [Fibrobacteraceae bacterium]